MKRLLVLLALTAPLAGETISVNLRRSITAVAAPLYVDVSGDTMTGLLVADDAGVAFPGATSGTTTLRAASVAGSTVLTLPAATDTLVGKATTDVFTNKSISGATNNVTALPNAALTNSTFVIGSTSVALGGTASTIAGLTLTAPTMSSIATTGNVGVGTTPNATTGRVADFLSSGNQATILDVSNTDAAGTSAQAVVRVTASTAQAAYRAYGSGNTSLGFGVTLGGYSGVIAAAGNGFIVGTTNAAPVIIGTNGGNRLTVASSGDVSLGGLALTAGTMTGSYEAAINSVTTCRSWTNAQVVALGATTAGDIAFGTLPAKTTVRNAYVVITGAAVGPATVTVSLGRTAASYIDYIVASDAKAAANTVYGDASGERGTNLTGYDLPSYTGTTVVNAHFVSTGANLSTVTGSAGTVCLTTERLP